MTFFLGLLRTFAKTRISRRQNLSPFRLIPTGFFMAITLEGMMAIGGLYAWSEDEVYWLMLFEESSVEVELFLLKDFRGSGTGDVLG